MSLSLYISEDLVIQMTGLRDAVTNDYVNNATMTYTLKTVSGTTVGGTANTPMPYVTSSNGIYRGTMDAAVSGSLTNGTIYYLEITVSGSVFRRIKCRGVYRGTT